MQIQYFMEHFSRSFGSSQSQSLQITVNVLDQIVYHGVYVMRSQTQSHVCLCCHHVDFVITSQLHSNDARVMAS